MADCRIFKDTRGRVGIVFDCNRAVGFQGEHGELDIIAGLEMPARGWFVPGVGDNIYVPTLGEALYIPAMVNLTRKRTRIDEQNFELSFEAAMEEALNVTSEKALTKLVAEMERAVAKEKNIMPWWEQELYWKGLGGFEE